MISVYLAGPEVFLENAVEIGLKKKQLCELYGLKGMFPFDNEIPAISSVSRIDHEIYKANVSMMMEADCGIVNLTPFRGPSADVGSVFELGLMVGLGKPVFGYTNVIGDLICRMVDLDLVDKSTIKTRPRDNLGMYIENFGNTDNLMIDSCLEIQGNKLITTQSNSDDIYQNLAGFEKCLILAANKFNLRKGKMTAGYR